MSEKKGFRRSLGFKLTVGIILIIVIVFAGLNTFNLLSSRKSRRAEALVNGETVARLVAGVILDQLVHSPLDSPEIRRTVGNFLNFGITLNKRNRDLAYAVVIDTDKSVIVGRAKPELTVFPGGKTYKDPKKVLEEVARLEGRLGGDMRTKRFPLKVGGKIVGKFIVGISLARLEAEIQRDLITSLSVFVATLVLLVVYASFTLRWLVVRPLTRVVDAMRSVQKGDLDQELEINRNDEMGQLANTYNFMVRGLREQRKLKDAFSRYVSKQVYDKMQMGEINLAGETRRATILFSDIRSFTSLSERLTPSQVVEMLNAYFTEMVEIVFRYDGFLNKFIGDALMAIYNVPVDQDQPELRAVRTAIEMMASLDKLNQAREAAGDFPVRIGIGINTGYVVAGNIGHQRRLEYTVIGDAVNLAQRIESQTKVAGAPILISETTHKAVAGQVLAEALPPVKVKGKAEPVKLYAVSGLAHEVHAAKAPIQMPPPVSGT